MSTSRDGNENNNNNNNEKIESISSSSSSTIPTFNRTTSDDIIDISLTRVNSISHNRHDQKPKSSKGNFLNEDLKLEGDYDEGVLKVEEEGEEEEEEEEYTYPEGGLKAWLAVLAYFIFGCSQLGVSLLPFLSISKTSTFTNFFLILSYLIYVDLNFDMNSTD